MEFKQSNIYLRKKYGRFLGKNLTPITTLPAILTIHFIEEDKLMVGTETNGRISLNLN